MNARYSSRRPACSHVSGTTYGKSTDREGEIHLGARRGMAALQFVEDEGLHLLLGDLARLDVGPDLLWREARVAGPERDVHHPDRIGRVRQQLDIDRGFHPG